MNPSEFIYFAVLVAILLATPFLPTDLLLSLDALAVRVALMVFLLFMIHKGPTVGLIAFVAIAALFLERNRRKVEGALKALDLMEVPSHATVAEATQPPSTVPVAPFDTPSHEEHDFLPHEEQHMTFEPVDASINQKSILSTIYAEGSASRAHQWYESLGFGHLPAHI